MKYNLNSKFKLLDRLAGLREELSHLIHDMQFPHYTTLNPFLHDSRKVTKFKLLEEIYQLINTIKRLQQLDQRIILESIMDTFPDYMIVLDQELKVVFLKTYEKIEGGIMNSPLISILAPEVRNELQEFLNLALIHGSSCSYFLELPMETGDILPLELRISTTNSDHIAVSIRSLVGKTLSFQQHNEFVLMCSYCRRVSNDSGDWIQFDHFDFSQSKVRFTHGICPSCYEEFLKTL
ncbi:MAG: hypothetical protein INQ03_07865 [Candidatus Heimdallarchaeota archaeon]|nr:hypothetical protein [Candidatus Heimdallarchaeota archaeon]